MEDPKKYKIWYFGNHDHPKPEPLRGKKEGQVSSPTFSPMIGENPRFSFKIQGGLGEKEVSRKSKDPPEKKVSGEVFGVKLGGNLGVNLITALANPHLPSQQNASSKMAILPPNLPPISPSIHQSFSQLFPKTRTLNPSCSTESVQLTFGKVLLGVPPATRGEEERARSSRTISGGFQEIFREIILRGLREGKGDNALGQGGNLGENEGEKVGNEGKERAKEGENNEVNVELELGIGGSRERKRGKKGEN